MEYKTIIFKECDKIQNQDIKVFAETALNNLPDYFFATAASTSGKYHPSYALGDGGLVRHTLAAARLAHHLFQLEQFQNQFSEDERDCVITAILLHDGWKHGNGNSIHSVHEHPQVCADWLRTSDILDNLISDEYREIIAAGISSHMGQWNTTKRSKIVLEKPNNKIQKFVHMCDYLASRKDIEILFDESESGEPPKIEEYKMPFGKYKGEPLIEVAKSHMDYLQWLKDNTKLQMPLKSFVDELLKGE